MSATALMSAEQTRVFTVALTDSASRKGYSQYLTPYQTARLAASMLSDNADKKILRCLDLGAGTGILSVALAERYNNHISVDGVEADPQLAAVYDKELDRLGIAHRIMEGDALLVPLVHTYERVILNPPYKKMAADDSRQAVLPVRSPNLYTAFLMRAIQALAPGGQCAAIVPRSWMNGQYFRAFREWMLNRVSIDAIHVYGSRSEIFLDTDVLQETMVLAVSKAKQRPIIRVSESDEKSGKPVAHEYLYQSLVDQGESRAVRVRPVESALLGQLRSLKEEGLCASTGKVVDFRLRDTLSFEYRAGLGRLIYPCNFTNEGFVHPVSGKKAQWIDCSSDAAKRLLISTGSYVVVKRFSAKEEQRRIKASLLTLAQPAALENHLNFIHAGTPRKAVALSKTEAQGLDIWLGSTDIERWFRSRSGSTQVNASDLNALPTPSRSLLVKLGQRWHPDMSQGEIDELCRLLVTP